MNRNLLIVDDEKSIVNSLLREIKKDGYKVYTANSGEEGLRILNEIDIGVILSDFMMPKMDGIEFLELVKNTRPHSVQMIITGYGSLENAMIAINRLQIFGYLTKPWSTEQLRYSIKRAFKYYNLKFENRRLHKITKKQNKHLAILNENLEMLVMKRTNQLNNAVREGIFMLAKAAEAKDGETGEHILRIQKLSKNICIALGMPTDKVDEISFFSIMHDVGKIHIPDHILNKRAKLNEQEWEIMKSHCIVGEKILGKTNFYKTAREIARNHHEKWDGSGYPDGRSGDAIPVSARVVTVADVYDALTHVRSYKPAWTVENALNEMKSQSGKAFDPDVLNAFFSTLANKGE